MDAVRTPCWMTAPARTTLTEAVTTTLRSADLHPVTECRLRDVLTELRVVNARDRVWPTKTALVRRATGYAADVLPIRISEDELASILDIQDLPASVRAALTGGKAIR